MGSSGHRSGDGSSTIAAQRLSSGSDADAAPLRRRLSLEEDFYYEEIMTAEPRPPSEQPPPYKPYQKRPQTWNVGAAQGKDNSPKTDKPPAYSTDIHLEGLWDKKMELVDTTRAAHDRQWRATLVQLCGTSLKFYGVKKEWGWEMAKEWAANPSPDNPPWAKRNGLLRSYNLQHADVGIAADYRKRRNVIRLRVETEQFLIACVESTTFSKWLEGLFAALAIAHPLDEREFPLDHSIPRSQRSRWLRAQRQMTPTRPRYPLPTSRPLSQLWLEESGASQFDGVEPSAGIFGALAEVNASSSSNSGRPYSMSISSSLLSLGHDIDTDADPWPSSEPQSPGPGHAGHAVDLARSNSSNSSSTSPARAISTSASSRVASVPRPANRRSATSSPAYLPPPTSAPTMSQPAEPTRLPTSGRVDRLSRGHRDSGKWRPLHEEQAPEADLRHGRLCFAILLFESPRKSNYIVKRQTKWFVDWETGRMVRVLPPTYSEIDQLEGGRQGSRLSRRLSGSVGL